MNASAKTKTVLTASQHFDKIYERVADIVDAIEIRSIDRMPIVDGVAKTAHLNGFINDEFDELATHAFLKKLKEHRVELLSFDLGPSCKHVRMEEFYKPGSAVLSPEEILKAGRERLKRIRSVYDGAVSMENLDYHEGGAYEHVCDPAFIRRAVRELNTGLTLDIAHANVTAFNTKVDVRDYIRMLPLDRLEEIHISHATGNEDTHGIPTDEDYDLLKYVFSIAAPRYIVLEYFQDPETMVSQMKRMRTNTDRMVAERVR